MITPQDVEKIKKEVEEFFQKMTFEVEVEARLEAEQTAIVSLQAPDPQILIGERGQTLAEIQLILRMILRKKIAEPFFLELDISDYKKKKIDYLKQMAQAAADEVVLIKKEKWLPAMTAQERRIIHMELLERTDVTTESVGEEPERRVVIKPLS